MELTPLRNRVVLQKIEPEEKQTEGGIVIPDTAQDQPQRAEVIAVGPGYMENGEVVEPDVEEGDIVLFSQYSGTEVEFSGEELLVMDAGDLLAVVK